MFCGGALPSYQALGAILQGLKGSIHISSNMGKASKATH